MAVQMTDGDGKKVYRGILYNFTKNDKFLGCIYYFLDGKLLKTSIRNGEIFSLFTITKSFIDKLNNIS